MGRGRTVGCRVLGRGRTVGCHVLGRGRTVRCRVLGRARHLQVPQVVSRPEGRSSTPYVRCPSEREGYAYCGCGWLFWLGVVGVVHVGVATDSACCGRG